MARKRYSAEPIIHKLREAEIALGQRPHSALNYRPPAPVAQSMDTSLLEVASTQTLT